MTLTLRVSSTVARGALVLAVLLGQVGCSTCYYDFTHPGSPKTFNEKMADLTACYGVATKDVDVSTASKEKQDLAAKDWMACVRERGYVVVKR